MERVGPHRRADGLIERHRLDREIECSGWSRRRGWFAVRPVVREMTIVSCAGPLIEFRAQSVSLLGYWSEVPGRAVTGGTGKCGAEDPIVREASWQEVRATAGLLLDLLRFVKLALLNQAGTV